MRIIAIALFVLFAATLTYQIQQQVSSDYQFEKNYLSFWNLADKSSTIDAKAKYISQFVEKLDADKSIFASHNAVWLKTPDNSFEKNLDALKTLKTRLLEIQKMDMKSFEYQTAIQQITAQEQGEAKDLIRTLHSCYEKENYPVVWNWYGGLTVLLWITALIVGFILLAVWWDDNSW